MFGYILLLSDFDTFYNHKFVYVFDLCKLQITMKVY